MSDQRDLEDVVDRIAETTAERLLQRPPIQRSPGRRTTDYQKKNAAWVLVVGTLMQGGFLAFSWRMMSVGERQLEYERVLLAQQHTALVDAIKEQTAKIEQLTIELRSQQKR